MAVHMMAQVPHTPACNIFCLVPHPPCFRGFIAMLRLQPKGGKRKNDNIDENSQSSLEQRSYLKKTKKPAVSAALT
jgi:hypothetical protein